MFETAVEDADEAVAKGTKRLMLCVAAGAMDHVIGTGAR